jgi:hypothetical protein
MKRTSLVFIAAGVLAAAPALAQPAAMPVPPVPPVPPLPDDTLLFAAGELRSERVVKGAPYCADAVHEAIQTLADGNRIVHRSTSRQCRDGEGRTRQEVERGGRKQVWLRDPGAQEAWLLDPERKTARALHARGGPGAEADSAAWREYADRMREWGRQFGERMRSDAGRPGAAAPMPVPPQPPQPPEPAVVGGNDVHVHVMRLDGPPGAMPPLPPAVAWRAPLLAPRGQAVVTPLPAREIEGLKANGERSTWTIEAGRVGNEKPITLVREVWTSPELMVTVMTRDADPRSGETVYRLTNVKRGEPDAALMKVPSDYQATPKR